MDEVANRHEGKPLPHMLPELYKDMPQSAQDILKLADNLYLLIHEQSVSSAPSSDMPASLNEALDKALNAYWNARHIVVNDGLFTSKIPKNFETHPMGLTDLELASEREAEVTAMRARYPESVKPAMAARTEAGLRALPLAYRVMNSAPKDGSSILIHCWWEPLTVVGKYMDGKWVVTWDEEDLSIGFEATHWTWLPEDPRRNIPII